MTNQELADELIAAAELDVLVAEPQSDEQKLQGMRLEMNYLD